MTALAEVLAKAPQMSSEEIASHIHERNRAMDNLLKENLQIHVYYERASLREQAAQMAANPALAQRVDTTFDLATMSDADLDTMLARIDQIRKNRGKK
jgi:hypothetical protein